MSPSDDASDLYVTCVKLCAGSSGGYSAKARADGVSTDREAGVPVDDNMVVANIVRASFGNELPSGRGCPGLTGGGFGFGVQQV